MSDTPTDVVAETPRPLRDHRVLIPLGLFALYVIWGSTYLGIRYALESYPPFLLAGIRFLGAGIVLYGFLRLRGLAPPTRLQWRNAAFTGLLLLGMGNGLVCFAEQHVSSGIAAVAVASMPLFAAVFSGHVRLVADTTREHRPGDRLCRRDRAEPGQQPVRLPPGRTRPAHRRDVLGVRLGLEPAPGHAPRPDEHRRADAVCERGIARGRLRQWRTPAGASDVARHAAVLYLAVFGSIIAFSAYLYVLKHARPALATSYAYVNPPVAVLFGVLLAGEHVGPYDLAGMAIILLGVGVITMAKQKRSA